ncbi:hypothetical protein O7632_26550 [Solwaraspora sp. WMMD406]|uniref:hypothetical protein n=1 Tax=Solwaraspora sp. WMMD406 TaxID=3016095 RepID=UPI0024168DFC|nr:hypothetical protein [Solwaraspora sp. WMMD406]MDG4767626.1 hypothetical protein [Solwaraspora sp. WMMD406]
MGGTVSRHRHGYRHAVTSDSVARPATLRWAVGLLTGEAVALGAVTVYLAYQDLTGTATDLVSALIVTGFAGGGTVLLGLLARALWQGRAGARAPAIVLQLMLLPVGYYMITGGLGWLGGPLIVLGLAVCVLLVSPPTTKAFGLD